MAYTPEKRITAQGMMDDLLPKVQRLRASLDQDMVSLKYLWTVIDKGGHLAEVEKVLALQDITKTLSVIEATLCRT